MQTACSDPDIVSKLILLRKRIILKHPLGVQPRPFHVNVEIKSRSPQETEDFMEMLEKDEIKHKT